MLPFSQDTVTLYHRRKYTDAFGKNQTEWIRTVLTGCSWGGTATRITVGDILITGSDTTVKIPVPCPEIEVGDILVQGELADPTPPKNGITVKTVKNNGHLGKRLRHIAVTGA